MASYDFYDDCRVPGHIVGEGPRPMFLSKLAQSPPSTYSITMHRCFLLSKLQYIETTKGLSVKVKMSLSEHLLNLVECSNHTPYDISSFLFVRHKQR